jgi:hypothetical protein
VNQLYSWYFGRLPSSEAAAQWARQLANGTLNSDSLTIVFLASETYANGSLNRAVPDIESPQTLTSQQFNRINHLKFILTGANGTRSSLSAIATQLYQGTSWGEVAKSLYDGLSATNARIQTQYQNLLHRMATVRELDDASKTLPKANQVEALQIQILSSMEYRQSSKNNTSYVNAVYQVLTGQLPDSVKLTAWTKELSQGLRLSQFVRTVAASESGKDGQINRAYLEYLLRDATATEINSWREVFGGSTPQDRPIALNLINSNQFIGQERTATLLPIA